jgi:D-arabinose 1-dehydrogenase-like Zn-dependent alcohol dehydrogenase
MKAAAVDRFGPPSALTRHDVPVPKPGPQEVLIAIDTAGVPIAASYPLGKADQAHRRMDRGQVLERMVLRVRRGR